MLERLSQPSSAAGLAALLALLVPQLAEYAPTIVDLALTVIAVGAAIVAMVRCGVDDDAPGHRIGRARRADRAVVDREAAPLRAQPAHAQRGAGNQLAASMVEFGWTNPVLVDEQGGILAGHGRPLAARKLGLAEVRRRGR